ATGGQCRDQREHEPTSGMQSLELFWRRKGKVDVRALEIGPTVTTASENTVKSIVNELILMRPQSRLLEGIHPRVHPSWHQTRPQGSKQPIDFFNLLNENA